MNDGPVVWKRSSRCTGYGWMAGRLGGQRLPVEFNEREKDTYLFANKPLFMHFPLCCHISPSPTMPRLRPFPASSIYNLAASLILLNARLDAVEISSIQLQVLPYTSLTDDYFHSNIFYLRIIEYETAKKWKDKKKREEMLNRLQVSGGWQMEAATKRNAAEMDAEKIFFNLFMFQCGIYARKYIFWYFFFYTGAEKRMWTEPILWFSVFFSFWITWVELHHRPMLDYYVGLVIRVSFFSSTRGRHIKWMKNNL